MANRWCCLQCRRQLTGKTLSRGECAEAPYRRQVNYPVVPDAGELLPQAAFCELLLDSGGQRVDDHQRCFWVACQRFNPYQRKSPGIGGLIPGIGKVELLQNGVV